MRYHQKKEKKHILEGEEHSDLQAVLDAEKKLPFAKKEKKGGI